jgi:hypothetical protein
MNKEDSFFIKILSLQQQAVQFMVVYAFSDPRQKIKDILTKYYALEIGLGKEEAFNELSDRLSNISEQNIMEYALFKISEEFSKKRQ